MTAVVISLINLTHEIQHFYSFCKGLLKMLIRDLTIKGYRCFEDFLWTV